MNLISVFMFNVYVSSYILKKIADTADFFPNILMLRQHSELGFLFLLHRP